MTHIIAALEINISVHERGLGPSSWNGARGPHPPHVPGVGESASGKKGPHLGQPQRREVMVTVRGLRFLPLEGEGQSAGLGIIMTGSHSSSVPPAR